MLNAAVSAFRDAGARTTAEGWAGALVPRLRFTAYKVPYAALPGWRRERAPRPS